jgi:glycosyltransferase involved in cell wall biosynthesis
LLRALEDHIATAQVHVFKNPPPLAMAPRAGFPKRRDVVFLGRFRPVKGVGYLDGLLRRLPAGVSVALAGRDSGSYSPPPEARCQVAVLGEVPGEERLRLLGESRVALTLSSFENCSMVILESLATGTVVAGWRVGGNDEIAAGSLVRLAPLGNIEALAEAIVSAIEGAYPADEEFRVATERLQEDFRSGWRHVWNSLHLPAPLPVYRGIDCAGAVAEPGGAAERVWLRAGTGRS